MKKLIITTLLFAAIVSTLQSQSYKFVAMDRYYDTSIPIDSILVHDMNNGEDEMFYTDSIYLATITSVEDYNDNTTLKLFPNPVEDILNIELTDGTSSTLIIADITGKVHFTYNAQPHQKISLNVAGLPTGAYSISYGNHTQKFVKTSSANGSEVSMISSESVHTSLIKEAEVQSQFDYRFTIYCSGFKPKSYYSETIGKDSIITLDMLSLPSAFDGKHIRVEVYLARLNIDYRTIDHNWPPSRDTLYSQYKNTFLDTVVIRDLKVDLKKDFEVQMKSTDAFKHQLIKFEIDTNNREIKNFSFVYEFLDGVAEVLELDEDQFKISFKTDSIKYSVLNNRIVCNLDMKNSNIRYNRSNYQSFSCSGHYKWWDMISIFPEESYIKIEIID